MSGVIGLIVAGLIVWSVVQAQAKKLSGGMLLKRGRPARGILLEVSQTPSGGVGTGSARLESRWVRIDVEVPGQQPYATRTLVWYPKSFARDVLPGATVELRVDAKKRDKIAIVGPGIGLAAAQLGVQSPS